MNLYEGAANGVIVRKVIFVGGDERQARVVRKLRLAPDLEVVSIQPAWNRNWNKALGAVERAAGDADAIAISTDVPTELGKSLRRLARSRGIPWTAGRARGRTAICGLIDQARELSEAADRPGRRKP